MICFALNFDVSEIETGEKVLEKIYFSTVVWTTNSILVRNASTAQAKIEREYLYELSLVFGEGEFPSPPPTHLKSPLDLYIFWMKYFMQYEKNILEERKEKKIVEFLYFSLAKKNVWEKGGLTSLCLFIGFHKPEITGACTKRCG